MEYRICIKCREKKDINKFRILTRKNNGKKHLQTTCRECEKNIALKYRNSHLNKCREYSKEYSKKNKNKKNEYAKKYLKNPCIKYAKQKSAILRTILKNKGKYSKDTKQIFGLNSKELYEYLIYTYKKNYGIEYNSDIKVHIDHIKPISSANTIDEIYALNYYTNLQLLNPKDNQIKFTKY